MMRLEELLAQRPQHDSRQIRAVGQAELSQGAAQERPLSKGARDAALSGCLHGQTFQAMERIPLLNGGLCVGRCHRFSAGLIMTVPSVRRTALPAAQKVRCMSLVDGT